MRIDEELRAYYNKSDAYIHEMRSHDYDYYKSYLDLIGNYVIEADNLLEVGCGSGASTRAIASKFPFLHCVGIDISEKAIEFAIKENRCKNLHFKIDDIKSLSFPNNSFSIVTSFDCLEHVSPLEDALVELMRVVKPGGYLIIKGPNHMSPLYTILDIFLLRYRYPFTRSWLHNFPRLIFQLIHLMFGLMGRVKFIPRVPDLSDSIQIGNDADAVTDMCNLDVYNFFKKAGWKILNISWPRGNSKGAALISKLLPFFSSMGIVVKKPLIK